MNKAIFPPSFPKVLIVMGVSGVGKTTVGRLLAKELNYAFSDADDYHPPKNIAKLRQGLPLTDQDRQLWLKRIYRLIHESLLAGKPIVLACSALKEFYRHLLMKDNPDIKFIYLKAPFECVHKRLLARKNHFMNPNLLENQYAILEEPKEALVINATFTPEEIVATILKGLNKT